MRLREYLKRRGETTAAFARRAGLRQQTVHVIVNGGGTTARTALAIIHATDGIVGLDDLVPETVDEPAAAP